MYLNVEHAIYGAYQAKLKKRRALITDTTELAFDRLMKGMDVQGSKLIPATGSNSSNQTLRLCGMHVK